MNVDSPYLPSLIPALEAAYQAPGRHYHDLNHIKDCLRAFEAVHDQSDDPQSVELAIWFHDVVYDPTRHDNEERSAEAAARALSALNAPCDLIARVEKLILATKHASAPDDTDAKLLVDVDLAILGRSAAEFDRYEAAIRREYAHVPDAAFAAGRAAVLRRFLERPSIYQISRFRERYEAMARENLLRSITACSKRSAT